MVSEKTASSSSQGTLALSDGRRGGKPADGSLPRRARGRIVRVRIDDGRYQTLDRLAADSGVTVDQLAGVLLMGRVDKLIRHTILLGILDEIRDFRRGFDTAGDGSPRPRKARTASAKRPRMKRGLHDEIIDVLRQRGQPMSAGEIADAIRKRGNYRPPRSGQPVTGAAVSRRVSNPNYRPLFERSGRSVSLASTADAR